MFFIQMFKCFNWRRITFLNRHVIPNFFTFTWKSIQQNVCICTFGNWNDSDRYICWKKSKRQLKMNLFILVLCVRLCTAKLIVAFPRAAYIRLALRRFGHSTLYKAKKNTQGPKSLFDDPLIDLYYFPNNRFDKSDLMLVPNGTQRNAINCLNIILFWMFVMWTN